jgi:dihydrofolate reductase
MKIALIAVVDENNGIGKDNHLLCHLPADLKRFKELTTGHSIIMGRKTFESLRNGPLPNRKNIVITKNPDYKANGCYIVHSVDQALEICKEEITAFVIGGEQIYSKFINIADILYITKIYQIFDADVFFPEINPDQWQLLDEIEKEPDEKNRFFYSFRFYSRNKAEGVN